MPPEGELATDALAIARLARLVPHDVISQGPRQAVIRWAYARDGRAGDLAELEEWGGPEEAVETDRNPPKLARLITCPWCAGMWVALGVVAARRVAPGLWRPLARALAASQVAGLVANL